MNADQVPVAALRRFLAVLPGYRVIREQDIWHNLQIGGDIDLWVEDIDRAERALIDHFGVPLVYMRRSYVREYAFLWGRIDLCSTVEWRGANYLTNEDVWRNAVVGSDGTSHAGEAQLALIAWFSSLLWGGFFKERYRSLIVGAARERTDEFYKLLHAAVGPVLAAELLRMAQADEADLSEALVPRLRRAVRYRSLKRDGLATIQRWLKFWYREVALRFDPPLPWIALLGPDGSGKTSTIEGLALAFPSSLACVERYHWRPNLLARRSRLAVEPVTDPHGEPLRGTAASIAKLGYLFFDWTIGYWRHLVDKRVKTGLIVFDRCHYDLLVDPKRYRYGGSQWLAKLIIRSLPKPNLIIVLDAPTEILRSRKQEVPVEETERQRAAYLHLAEGLPFAHVLDASRPVQTVVSDILWLIRSQLEMHARRVLSERGS